MKKRQLFIVILCLFLFGATSCSKKAISSDKMASLFVNKFIYEKNTSEFEENFVDGDIVGKQLEIMTDNFENTFSDVFDSITEKLTNEEKEQLANHLMMKMRKESSYTDSIKKITNSEVEVTYSIKGFDYARLVETTLESILLKLTNYPSITEEERSDELVSSFEKSLEGIKAGDTIQDVTLTFKKIKNKWQIGDHQDDKLEQILLSFVTGQKDKESYEKEMNSVVERVIKKAGN